MAPKLDTSDLPRLARHLLTTGPVKTHRTTRRVRALFNGAYITDTTQALLVWEHEYYPQLYVPTAALQHCTCEDTDQIRGPDGHERAAIARVTVQGRGAGRGTRSTERALRFLGGAGALAKLVRLEFGAMDAWLEEDAPVLVHPKDPFKRVDILPSSRPVAVRVGGRTVADAPNSWHLLETGLPTRYYLPLGCVDPDVLRPSDTVTKCPYKGEAQYYDVVVDGKVHKDLVWYYRTPTAESAAVAGLVCFYNEKVDIVLDGVELERPDTPFS